MVHHFWRNQISISPAATDTKLQFCWVNHSWTTPIWDSHYPSLISGFSCCPTPDGVWLWSWAVITFAQHALSNQDNWHQTANYKGRVELCVEVSSFLCVFISVYPAQRIVQESIKLILCFLTTVTSIAVFLSLFVVRHFRSWWRPKREITIKWVETDTILVLLQRM